MDEQVNIPALRHVSEGGTHSWTLSVFLAIDVEKQGLAVGKSAATKVLWSKFGRKAGNSGKRGATKNF